MLEMKKFCKEDAEGQKKLYVDISKLNVEQLQHHLQQFQQGGGHPHVEGGNSDLIQICSFECLVYIAHVCLSV